MEKLYCSYYAGLGTGISGGDNILIELARRWAKKFNITIFLGREGFGVCARQNLLGVNLDICPSLTPFRYLERLIWSIHTAFVVKRPDIVYTSSDFLHDFIFGLILKLRFKMKWVAGCYLVAPPPFAKCSPYVGMARIRGIGYWLSQRPVLYLMKRYADVICVTSEPERRHFPRNKVVVVRGGVKIPELFPVQKLFDVIFLGRFHYQKGVLELVDIWRRVKFWFPKATLLMVGHGKLLKECKRRAKDLDIEFVDFADEKLKEVYFRASRIIVHPAIFDSGGMSAAEGMAYGLPAVGFDLETHKTYYPKGMLKAKTKEEFANYIRLLMLDKKLYETVSQDALETTRELWDWDKQAERLKELLLQDAADRQETTLSVP